MKVIHLGIGEIAATRVPGEVLKTLALGSCIAVCLLDPERRVVGMAHIALPESSLNPEEAQTRPGRFADTGIPALLFAMKARGFHGQPSDLIVKLAGGAQVADPGQVFNIGARNLSAIQRHLKFHGMSIAAEDCGGTLSRSVRVDVDLGKVIIFSPGRKDREL